MEDAGQKLKRRREELNLRYRDVEDASSRIAERRNSDEFNIVISRLSEIENRGAIPSIYKLYSLCAIYRLDLTEVLRWYGIDVSALPFDAGLAPVSRTHTIEFSPDTDADVTVPLSLDPGLDIRKTTFLSRMVQKWGRLPLLMMGSADPRIFRYGYVGTDDWSMHPIIQPGSLLLIDETKRRIQFSGWTDEQDRPVYLLEHREGHLIGWCSQAEKSIIVLPHPSSDYSARVFSFPDEIEVVGQVVGIAMRLEPKRQRGKS